MSKKKRLSATKKKDKPTPYFLMGKAGLAKGSAILKAPRTAHKKRKDSKTLDVIRGSAKTELIWIRKWKAAHKPKKVNANDDGKEAKDDNKDDGKNNENKKTELKESDIDYDPMTLEVCLKMLLTLDEAWEDRLIILGELEKQLVSAGSEQIYAFKMCKFLHAIGVQWSDPRSLIAQGLEEVLSKIVKETAKQFVFFAPYVLNSLMSPFAIRIEALRDAAIKFGETMIYECEPYDKNYNYALLRQLLIGLDSKHKGSTTICADLVYYYITKFDCLENDDADDSQQQLLKEICDGVAKMVKHAAAETRMNGYRALNIMEIKVAPKFARATLDKFTNAKIHKYEQAYKKGRYHPKKKKQ